MLSHSGFEYNCKLFDLFALNVLEISEADVELVLTGFSIAFVEQQPGRIEEVYVVVSTLRVVA